MAKSLSRTNIFNGVLCQIRTDATSSTEMRANH